MPDGETWCAAGLRHRALWNSLPPGSGTGMEISIRADDGGAPGPTLVTLNVTGYLEVDLGMIHFDRQEYEAFTTFDEVCLDAGHYWFEANVIGPENNFWLIRQEVTNHESWVNYDDLGGLQPARGIFGGPADLGWSLRGCCAVGACCLADGACIDTTAPECASAGGTFGAPGVACDAFTCPRPGACCRSDGSCDVVLESACLATGGIFFGGDDSSCADVSCLGACCLDDGGCAEGVTAAECTEGLGGDFEGVGSDCASNTCSFGACCLGDGTCIEALSSECGAAGGVHQAAGAPCVETSCAARAGDLVASDGTPDDRFGNAVAIDGDTLVVGAVEDDDAVPLSGSAYVFERHGGQWTETVKLIASDRSAADYFGRDVSIDGDHAIVGASGRNAAYVFHRHEGGANAWGQVARLSATDGGFNDTYGTAVAISGSTAVVGAPRNDEPENNAGTAYVYERDPKTGSWDEVARLTATDAGAWHLFGACRGDRRRDDRGRRRARQRRHRVLRRDLRLRALRARRWQLAGAGKADRVGLRAV